MILIACCALICFCNTMALIANWKERRDRKLGEKFVSSYHGDLPSFEIFYPMLLKEEAQSSWSFRAAAVLAYNQELARQERERKMTLNEELLHEDDAYPFPQVTPPRLIRTFGDPDYYDGA